MKTFDESNLWIILEYFNDDEVKHLESELEKDLPDDLGEAIKEIERLGRTDHIAYSLMILNQELNENSKNRT